MEVDLKRFESTSNTYHAFICTPMLILRPPNSDLKRLINIQKCRSSTKLDHCALSPSFSERKYKMIFHFSSFFSPEPKVDFGTNKVFRLIVFNSVVPSSIEALTAPV